MRKLAFVALLAIVSVTSQAQESCKAFTLPEFTTGKAVWMIRAGIGFNGVTGNATDTQQALWEDDKYDGSFKKNLGYNAMFGFNKSFGTHPLYWGMELGFSMRGYKTSAVKESTVDYSVAAGSGHTYSRKTGEMTFNLYDAQFSPFIIGYKSVINNRMAVDIHLGAYATYDFAGNKKVFSSSYTSYRTSVGNKVKSDDDETSVDIGDVKNLNRYDAGFNLGVGYWLGHYNIDFSWQRGFIPVYDDGDTLIKIGEKREFGDLFTNNLLLRMGYAF